jgi:Ca2+-binding RTX toxin-like protein
VYVASPEVATDAALDGGDGRDLLSLTTGDTAVGLDLITQTLTTSLGSSRLASFESTDLATGTGKVTFRGTAGDDLLTVNPGAATPVDISTEGGQDGIVVEPATIAAGSRIDGGEGRNKLIAATGTGQMTLDLRQDLLVIDGRSMTATGIQDAFLIATDVVMVGDQRGNLLSFAGCRADLRGEHGRDRLVNAYDGYFEKYTFDCAAETRMSGGGGADYLRGGQGVDRLVGGSGTDELEGRGGDDRIRGNAAGDTIDGGEGRDDVRGGGGPDELDGKYGADTLVGGSGRDRCVAEREQRCER